MTETFSQEEIDDLAAMMSKSTDKYKKHNPEMLSQEEIDSLLKAISTGEVDTTEYSHCNQKKVKIYDFRRPDRFTKENITMLQKIHEIFARLTALSLSSQLQENCNIYIASVDQIRYDEFIRSIPNPTTLAVVNLDPLKGSGLLEIDPRITYAFLSKIFGASEISNVDDDCKTLQYRELTDIELSTMEGVVVRMLGNLRESWSNVLDLRPRLGNIECNLKFAQIVPSDDMCVLITFGCIIGEVEGLINLLIPYITLENIVDKLTVSHMFSFLIKEDMKENKNYDVYCEVEMYQGVISLLELKQIKKGSFIQLSDMKLRLKQDNIIIGEK